LTEARPGRSNALESPEGAMALVVTERWSPNHDARGADLAGAKPSLVVIHYTGMTDAGAALARMCDPAAKVSAHYVIDESGAIVRMVPDNRRAWHAGRSYWRGIRDVNSASIGIELVNPGHEFGYRAFPERQIDRLLALLAEVTTRHGVSRAGVLGHSDVAPGRKTDPGELFPWRRLAAASFGLWPVAPPRAAPDRTIACTQLSTIGYAVPTAPAAGADLLDPARGLADVVEAFQRHYRQHRVDGVLDDETAGLIASVARESAALATS
jgi:N-acetylmuramoyl-L-alanine amidase